MRLFILSVQNAQVFLCRGLFPYFYLISPFFTLFLYISAVWSFAPVRKGLTPGHAASVNFLSRKGQFSDYVEFCRSATERILLRGDIHKDD